MDNNVIFVLFFIVKDIIDDCVIGFDLGVDDYLVKLFVFDELLVRIWVLMWRIIGNIFNVFEIVDLVVDCNMYKVIWGD